MTSNRPALDDARARSERGRGALLPGDVPSRAEAWRRWLTTSVPGRILLVGLIIKALAWTAGAIAPSTWAALDIVDAIGSLALIFVAGYALTRLVVVAKRHLLWRVRRKLILSYIFVGLVPGLLIIVFFLI